VILNDPALTRSQLRSPSRWLSSGRLLIRPGAGASLTIPTKAVLMPRFIRISAVFGCSVGGSAAADCNARRRLGSDAWPLNAKAPDSINISQSLS
jgi:hypothetical protein